jgi:hypothetical protein
MNRSYSKIRHIQEANLMLERRMMSEKRMIYEIEMKDGEILVTARPQEDVDKGVTSVSFQIMNDVLGQTPYYYKCAAEKDSTPAQQVDHEKPGAMYDGNLKLVSAASLGLIDGWKDKLRVGCKPVYDHLANWRKTFCPDLKNKTKPYYDWNCPKAAEPVAAAAETYVMPEVTDEGEGPIQNAEGYKRTHNSSSFPFNGKVYYLIISDYIMWRWQSESARHPRYFTTGNPFTLGVGKPNAPYIDYPRGTDITDLVLKWTK